MEKEKNEDRNETVDQEVFDEKAVDQEAEEKEERRGLFGAKKRERNEKAIMVIYAIAGVYLLYTAYMTAKELINGKVEPGRDTVISVVFTVIFAVAAVWILISSWRLRNILKAQEEEEAKKLAEEMAERGEKPEEPAKGGLLGGILVKPEMPSVASRASVYYNPADEDSGEDEDEGSEEDDGDSGEGDKDFEGDGAAPDKESGEPEENGSDVRPEAGGEGPEEKEV